MIKSMRGFLQQARGYGSNGYELVVSVSFDAAEFNRIKKKQDPLGHYMSQIKNVVLDCCEVRGVPSYQPLTMRQRFPRAQNGTITVKLYFELTDTQAKNVSIGNKYQFLNDTLEATRNESHLFAKSVIASHFGN
jgi:hypothetical protein